MRECRCKKCRKLLFKYRNGAIIKEHGVEIKCDRCGTINYPDGGNNDELIG